MMTLTLSVKKIDSIINSTDKKNKPKIDKLIGKGVQLFHGLIPIGETPFVYAKKKEKVAA